MKIGFSTIYSWRPHVEHCYFLATLAEKAGCETYFLQCNADLKHCYNHELKNSPARLECLKCSLGNISTYTKKNVASIGDYEPQIEHKREFNEGWVHSSASTLGRFESNEDYQSTDFSDIVDRLKSPASFTYSAARQWIKSNSLDAVCVFNGRIDHTRAVYEAALAEGIKVFSMERPWFSRGIQIYPHENCLGLKSVQRMVLEWSNKPLTREQALTAASYAARRFLKKNKDEWRAYNQQSVQQTWPGAGPGFKVLIVPSSRNEIYGQPDYQSEWSDPLAGYDAVLSALDISLQQVVLRCHPNWSELIGKTSGTNSENYYTDWAIRRGIRLIDSRDKADTLGLIRQADIVLVAHGSAALEAGLLGKTVISTAPAIYSTAGFVVNAHNISSISCLDEALQQIQCQQLVDSQSLARNALRFAYTMTHRVPCYVDAVTPTTLTEMDYATNCDPQQLVRLFETCKLEPNDKTFAENEHAEDGVLVQVLSEQWEAILLSSGGSIPLSEGQRLKRRWPYRISTQIRKLLPKGDR
jgi:hypothetical protein